MGPSRPGNRRSDARRSRTRILDAALRVLNEDPEASVEAVATAAGVTRQTVYAHFATRQLLLSSVVDRITEEAVAAIDAADVDSGPAMDALMRLIDASARTTGRYPVLLRKLATLQVAPEDDHAHHTEVTARLRRVIERGQRTGEFDGRLSPDWLAAVVIRLAHLASEETDAGRVVPAEARTMLRVSLVRVFGAETPDGGPGREVRPFRGGSGR